MTEERRQHDRVNVSWRLKVPLPGKGIAEGKLRDVSISGLSIELPVSAEIGQELIMQIDVYLADKKRLITAKARVVHVWLLGGNRGYCIGLEFTKIAKGDVEYISEVVDDILMIQYRRNEESSL